MPVKHILRLDGRIRRAALETDYCSWPELTWCCGFRSVFAAAVRERNPELARRALEDLFVEEAHPVDAFGWGLPVTRRELEAIADGLTRYSWAHEEMRRLGSLVMRAADSTAVPAGRALAVDREAFAETIHTAIESHPRIEVRCEAVEKIPDAAIAILATGPLTDPPLAGEIQRLLGD